MVTKDPKTLVTSKTKRFCFIFFPTDQLQVGSIDLLYSIIQATRIASFWNSLFFPQRERGGRPPRLSEPSAGICRLSLLSAQVSLAKGSHVANPPLLPPGQAERGNRPWALRNQQTTSFLHSAVCLSPRNTVLLKTQSGVRSLWHILNGSFQAEDFNQIMILKLGIGWGQY